MAVFDARLMRLIKPVIHSLIHSQLKILITCEIKLNYKC